MYSPSFIGLVTPSLCLFIAMTLLVSCRSHEEEVDTPALALQTAYCSFAATRSTDVDVWEMYDQVGITMCYHAPNAHPNTDGVVTDGLTNDGRKAFNRCYYALASGQTAFTYLTLDDRIWFPTDTTQVDFVAYYPYSGLVTISQPRLPIDLRQQHRVDVRLCENDVMWGAARGCDKAHTQVNICFVHQLTQVVCYIVPRGDLRMEQLRDATVEITHQPCQATMEVLSAALHYQPEEQTLAMKSATAVVEGVPCLVASAILLPNDEQQNPVRFLNTDDPVASLATNRHLLLTLPSQEGRTLRLNLRDVEFRPGQKHIFRLEARQDQLRMISGDIVEWEVVEHENEILDN